MIGVMSASGQLGAGVVGHLLRNGVAPTGLAALTRDPAKLRHFADLGVQVKPADYADCTSMAQAFRDVDSLVLIPTKSPVVRRIQEHANALEAARQAGVRRIILLSISAARPDSRSIIAPFYLYAESATRLSGMDWLILRMGLYLDPLADWAPELAATGQLPYPVERGRVAYVVRDDVARATAAAALSPGTRGEVLELTGPAAMSMTELAADLSTATGREIRFRTVSEEAFLNICLQGGEPPLISQILISLYRAVDAGEFARATDHIERLTGTPARGALDYLTDVLSNISHTTRSTSS